MSESAGPSYRSQLATILLLCIGSWLLFIAIFAAIYAGAVWIMH